MEGSTVRRTDRIHSALLNEARDIHIFQSEIVRLASAELRNVEVFFGLMDGSKGVTLPSWVRSHLDRHPSLYKKLELNELVGISDNEDNPTLRPAGSARSNILLIPVINETVLYGAIGLVSPAEDPQFFSQEGLETVRQFARDAGLVLARLDEIQRLRRENMELAGFAERLAPTEKRLAKITEERNALEAAVRMRSHLQSNIAHDLRTPLAAVRGYARMMLDGRTGEIDKTQRDYLTVIKDNSNRLINVVNWMTHVAEMSLQYLRISTFDLRDVWTERLKAHEAALNEKSIEVMEEIAKEPFVLVGDREKLAFVFNGLIGAALNLNKSGGTIRAEFLHGRDREIAVKISWNGECIPSEMLSNVFDRWTNAIPLPPQNMNVGEFHLSGIYDVVGMHGGRVFVDSKAGEGSTFLFTLPAVISDGEENFDHEQAVNSSC
jgi:signal transduction histidine kinase